MAVLECLSEEPHQAMTFEQSSGETQVQQTDNFSNPQLDHPAFEVIQLARGVSCAHQRSDGSSADQIRLHAGFLQRTNDADVRPAASGSAT